jgi:ribosomal subunit interface protein
MDLDDLGGRPRQAGVLTTGPAVETSPRLSASWRRSAMELSFRAYFKQMESSPALNAYAKRKIVAVIRKYVPRPIQAQVTFQVENGVNRMTCRVAAGGGFSLQVEYSDDISMYSCVDGLADRLGRRLRQHKERVTNHKNRATTPAWVFAPRISNAAVADDSIDAAYVIEAERARRTMMSSQGGW